MINGPDGFLLFAQNIIIDILIPCQFHDKINIISVKKIVIVICDKKPFFFCPDHSGRIVFFIGHSHDPGRYFLKCMPFDQVCQLSAAGASAHNCNIHTVNSPVSKLVFLQPGLH